MVTAIYDGYCVFCTQSKRIIEALDWLKRVEFLDLHNWNEVEARYPNLNYEQAMGQMHVVTPEGQLIGGFVGARRLLRELPLGFPFWALLHVPGIAWLGDKIYRWIAANRYRINQLVGAPVCENGVCKIHPRK